MQTLSEWLTGLAEFLEFDAALLQRQAMTESARGSRTIAIEARAWARRLEGSVVAKAVADHKWGKHWAATPQRVADGDTPTEALANLQRALMED